MSGAWANPANQAFGALMGSRYRRSNWPFRRAGRRKYARGGRFKRGGKSRRACLMGTHPEKKFVDLALTPAPAVTGTVSLLSLIAQDVTESARVGRKAIITDILIKGHVQIAAGASSSAGNNRVRFDIVQDTQTNGATFTVADYVNTAGTADINSYRDLSHAHRFKTLATKTMTVNAAAGGGDGTTNWTSQTWRPFQMRVKCCIPIEYDASAATGAIGTQQVNSIHLVSFEEAASPATTTVLNSRIRFVE